VKLRLFRRNVESVLVERLRASDNKRIGGTLGRLGLGYHGPYFRCDRSEYGLSLPIESNSECLMRLCGWAELNRCLRYCSTETAALVGAFLPTNS